MRKGGLTAAEESIIYNSSWGKDLLKNAYTSNNEFRAFVDSHGGRDALNNPGFVAKFKREWKGKSLFWLLLFAMPLLSAAKTAATSPNPYV